MRVTNNLLIHNMLWNMNNNLVSMNEKQTQLSTGKKIHKPSDDPVGTTRVIKVKSDIVENQQYKDNVRDAQSWLEVSENSLMDTKNILQRIRELAVQGANDTYTAEETDKIAKEIDQLVEELIVNANSTIAGRYLFSGFRTDTLLINNDGTYNIDITSEKAKSFKSIAYEVAVGEYLPVGTNYLDIYGTVNADNTTIDSFIFGKNSNGNVQYAEATGKSATHSKAQFKFDYKVDLSGIAGDVEVHLDSVTYRLDKSKLVGNISQDEFIDILKEASENPPPPLPAVAKKLGQSTQLYFVAGDDPSNTLGELVIEANDFGNKVIDVSDMATLTYTAGTPKVTTGKAIVKGVNAKLDGYIDYSQNLKNETLAFVFGDVTYTVDTSKFDGTLTEKEFIELIDNAKDSTGRLLKEDVNVKFKSTGGTIGLLSMEAKVASNALLTIKDSGDVFPVFPKTTTGIAGEYGEKAQIKGAIDLTKDISAAPLGTLSFTIGGDTYTVDNTLFNSGITPAAAKAAFENASNGSGGILSDVANFEYLNTSNPYIIKIEAKNPTDEMPELVDNSTLFLSPPLLKKGEAVEASDQGKRAVLYGPVDLSKDMRGAAVGDLSFDFDGKTYVVDTSAMDGLKSSDAVKTFIENASDGMGNKLGDVAYINIDNSGSPATLTIEAKDPKSFTPSGTDKSGWFLTGVNKVNGVANEKGTPSTMKVSMDLTKNLSGPPPKKLSFTVAGIRYDVATTALNGGAGLISTDLLNALNNAEDVGGNKLSTVANISIDSTVNPYEVTIEAKTPANDTIDAVDEGGMMVKNPYTLGMKTVEPTKAKIEGTFNYGTNITAGSLAFVVNGTTYRADLSTMDGTVTEKEFLEVIKNASTSPPGGKLSDWMNISFTPTTGTQGTLVIEQKTGEDAVVTMAGTSGYTGTPTTTNGVDGVIGGKAIVTGIGKITDEMLADPIHGVGKQSFVITYGDETKRIDVDLTDINTTAELKKAVDAELKIAFGDDGGSPATNNVTFDVVYNGTHDVIQFTGASKDDGSQSYLKVDVIVSDNPELIKDIKDFSTALSNKDNDGVNAFLTKLDDHLDNVLSVLAGIGAKNNRLDFIENRINDNNLSMKEILTKVQDIDYAEVTIQFKSLESIYRASLSVGAKVIQPTLVDFIQ